MKTFSKKVVPGTRVKLIGIEDWVKLKAVHDTRKWIEVEEYMGSFQVGHVVRFTNALGRMCV